jgi:hypothetical protein
MAALRVGFLLGLACILASCSLSPVIDQDVLDYFRVNDLASNRTILLNLLRAKDGAPLHFSELAQVRGQVTLAATTGASFPFGPYSHATQVPRDLLTLSGNVSSAPSFDINSLDTQDFTKGVMAQITPDTARFFLDEGRDFRIVLLMLASGIRYGGNTETLLNAPNSSRIVCFEQSLGPNGVSHKYTIQDPGEHCAGTSEPEFYGFLRAINHLHRIYAVSGRQPRAIGKPFTLDMKQDLKNILTMDPEKISFKNLPSGQVQLESTVGAAWTALCEEAKDGGKPKVVGTFASREEMISEVPESTCIPGGTDKGAKDDLKIEVGHDPDTFVVTLRSTLGVINYIGQILAFQDLETSSNPNGLERCVTLEYERLDGPTCNGGTLFHLLRDTAPVAESVEYGGKFWSLPDPAVCIAGQPCDHTLEAMSMVSLLLNQNKSSKDISKTPAFEAVP